MPHQQAHFNPLPSHNHGGMEQSPRHAGDLGTSVNADGTGTLEVVLKGLTVASGDLSVVGRALVLHEKPDDLHAHSRPEIPEPALAAA